MSRQRPASRPFAGGEDDDDEGDDDGGVDDDDDDMDDVDDDDIDDDDIDGVDDDDNINGDNTDSRPYTYIHQTLNQTKWNDHFLVSSSLLPATSDHIILDDGGNTSDHLPLMMKMSCQISPTPPVADAPAKDPSLKWEKCSEEQKADYNRRLAALLNDFPSRLTACSHTHCTEEKCKSAIQAEYDTIIAQMSDADKVLPRHRPGVQKHWWTDELTSLRSQSIEIHRLWQAEGKPRQGPTYKERLRVRAAYKRAIRAAQKAPKQSCWNRLHGALASKDSNKFWKSWKQLYSKNGSDLHTVVNGKTEKEEIAQSFKSHFVKVSEPNNSQRVEGLSEKFRVKHEEALSEHAKNCTCHTYHISLQTVLDAAFRMKRGKCSDDAKISAEHFFNAPLVLFDRFQGLFNAMLRHSIVPSQFQLGTIVPIVKDRQADLGDHNNYRGITIAPIASKVFEHTLQLTFSDFLSTSKYQFGFKRKSSTSHALFVLKETINYYTSHGSNVYCSFLDATKAFDRLVHAGLFLKLLERGTPLIFLSIIISWYSNLKCRVRWGDTMSEWFPILAGVRQGGILSPVFYSIYVDDLVQILSEAGIGCHIRDVFLSILLYADDMCLTAPSLKGLQRLLQVTENYCKDWDICLNSKKSKNMSFGKVLPDLPQLILDGKPLDWVDSWPYLGIKLSSSKRYNCCIVDKVKSFYRSANAILRIDGHSNELVMLQLLESQCLPILSYGIDVIEVADRDSRRKLRVAYNSIYRKVFGYTKRESVTELQQQLGRPTWEEFIQKKKDKFLETISHSTLLCTFL